jgi:hypothetical protein
VLVVVELVIFFAIHTRVWAAIMGIRGATHLLHDSPRVPLAQAVAAHRAVLADPSSISSGGSGGSSDVVVVVDGSNLKHALLSSSSSSSSSSGVYPFAAAHRAIHGLLATLIDAGVDRIAVFFDRQYLAASITTASAAAPAAASAPASVLRTVGERETKIVRDAQRRAALFDNRPAELMQQQLHSPAPCAAARVCAVAATAAFGASPQGSGRVVIHSGDDASLVVYAVQHRALAVVSRDSDFAVISPRLRLLPIDDVYALASSSGSEAPGVRLVSLEELAGVHLASAHVAATFREQLSEADRTMVLRTLFVQHMVERERQQKDRDAAVPSQSRTETFVNAVLEAATTVATSTEEKTLSRAALRAHLEASGVHLTSDLRRATQLEDDLANAMAHAGFLHVQKAAGDAGDLVMQDETNHARVLLGEYEAFTGAAVENIVQALTHGCLSNAMKLLVDHKIYACTWVQHTWAWSDGGCEIMLDALRARLAAICFGGVRGENRGNGNGKTEDKSKGDDEEEDDDDDAEDEDEDDDQVLARLALSQRNRSKAVTQRPVQPVSPRWPPEVSVEVLRPDCESIFRVVPYTASARPLVAARAVSNEERKQVLETILLDGEGDEHAKTLIEFVRSEAVADDYGTVLVVLSLRRLLHAFGTPQSAWEMFLRVHVQCADSVNARLRAVPVVVEEEDLARAQRRSVAPVESEMCAIGCALELVLNLALTASALLDLDSVFAVSLRIDSPPRAQSATGRTVAMPPPAEREEGVVPGGSPSASESISVKATPMAAAAVVAAPVSSTPASATTEESGEWQEVRPSRPSGRRGGQGQARGGGGGGGGGRRW